MELTGESLTKIQDRFDNVFVVIIDEYAMVSLDLLGKIESRLRRAKGRRDVPVGCVNVILVGDPGQLLPVGGTPLYEHSVNHFVCKEKLHMQIPSRLLYWTRLSGNKKILVTLFTLYLILNFTGYKYVHFYIFVRPLRGSVHAGPALILNGS